MVTVPINLTGSTFKHKSLPLSAQVCRGWWPQKQSDKKALSEYILCSFPGLKLFGTAVGLDRGMHEHLGIFYKVTGQTLYSVSSAGVHSSLGTIPGTDRCIFASIGTSIVIVTGGIPYVWDGTTLTTVTDSDLETPNSVCHLNNQIIYDGDEGRFVVSDVGDATSISSLNYATAESDADDVVRVYSLRNNLLVMGDKTIQPYWNTGDGNPPFDPIITGNIFVGLGALHSVANNDTVCYFLGDDDQVYVLQGYNAAVISTEAMAREFSHYLTTEDAIGFCFTLQGKNFYILTFPTQDKTWIYQEGGEWFELSSGADGGRWIGNSYAFCFRKHLIADYRNGNIYELDENTFTDNGSAIVRVRDSAPLHGGLFQAPGKRLEMNRFELIMETGGGIISGQGSDPVVMLSFSDDGGRTFSTEMWGTVGKLGEFQYKVEWFALGSFETRILRIRTSDPIYYAIYSAAADLEIGI
jgi:hypothetical protein